MRYFYQPISLIQTLLLFGSTSVLASFLNLDGGTEDVKTVFDLHRDIIGACSVVDILDKSYKPYESISVPRRVHTIFLHRSCGPQSLLRTTFMILIFGFIIALQIKTFWHQNAPKVQVMNV